MTLDDSLRAALVVEKEGYPYVIHPLMDGVPRVDPALLEDWCAWARQSTLLDEATVLLAPEAMAIPLAVSLSLTTRIPYLVVRKRDYGLDGERQVYAETGYNASQLYLNDLRADDRVVVIDDVLSTGGTLDGLLMALGPQAVGALVCIDKGDARGRLETKHGVPVQVMRRIQVQGGAVTLPV